MSKSEYLISWELQQECARELLELSKVIEAYIFSSKVVLDRLVSFEAHDDYVQRHTAYNSMVKDVLTKANRLKKYLWENNVNELLSASNSQRETRNSNLQIRDQQTKQSQPIAHDYETSKKSSRMSTLIKSLNLTESPMETLPLHTSVEIRPASLESLEIFYGYVDAPEQKLLSWGDKQVIVNLLKMPINDALMLVRNSKDTRWYRGRMLDYDERKKLYKVFAVDFGWIFSVPLHYLTNCDLNEKEVPYQALRCHIVNVEEMFNDIKPNQRKSLKTLRDLFDNSIVTCKIKRRVSDTLFLRIKKIKKFA